MLSKIFEPSRMFAAVAGVSLAVVSFGADAMPAATVAGVSAAPQITRVAEGCGVGFARGPAGVCRRIGGVVVVRPVRPLRPIVRVRPRCGVRVGPVGVATPC